MNKPIALIIEDDQNVAELYKLTLEEAGYEPKIALDGKSAFEELAQCQPKLIMLDMHLPDAYGQDILIQLRQQPRLAKTYIILATGEPKSVDNHSDELANFVLTKPIEYSQLLNLSKRVLHSLNQ